MAVAANVALGLHAYAARRQVERLGLRDHLTGLEQKVIFGSLSDEALARFAYHQDAALALSWALGITPAPGYGPEEDEDFVLALLGATAEECAMRPADEILDELDFARCYRALYHRAYPGDTDYGTAKTLGPILRGTVALRHEALVWLTHPNAPWPPGPATAPFCPLSRNGR